jgi:hypothetical protein
MAADLQTFGTVAACHGAHKHSIARHSIRVAPGLITHMCHGSSSCPCSCHDLQECASPTLEYGMHTRLPRETTLHMMARQLSAYSSRTK